MSKSKTIKAVIAIDLGSKNTGVFCSCHNVESPNNKTTNAATIVLPSTNDFKYSTKERTAVRHRLRGIKRFKFARKLLLMIINKKIKDLNFEFSNNKTWVEATCGLLKKRGYNRVSVDINYDRLKPDIVRSAFSNHIIPNTTIGLSNYFTNIDNRDIATQWEDLSQNLDTVKSLYELIKKIKRQKIEGKEVEPFKLWLKENPYTSSEISQCTEALKILEEVVSNVATFESLGHKNRKDYLKDILTDIQKDSRLKEVSDLFGGYEAFSLHFALKNDYFNHFTCNY